MSEPIPLLEAPLDQDFPVSAVLTSNSYHKLKCRPKRDYYARLLVQSSGGCPLPKQARTYMTMSLPRSTELRLLRNTRVTDNKCPPFSLGNGLMNDPLECLDRSRLVKSETGDIVNKETTQE
jgi:hypothetical protein